MSALERDLQRVLTDKGHVADPKLVVVQGLDPGKPARRTGLATTLRTGTRPSQLLARVGASRPILPRDLNHLAGAVDVDVGRKRIRVLQPSGR